MTGCWSENTLSPLGFARKVLVIKLLIARTLANHYPNIYQIMNIKPKIFAFTAGLMWFSFGAAFAQNTRTEKDLLGERRDGVMERYLKGETQNANEMGKTHGPQRSRA